MRPRPPMKAMRIHPAIDLLSIPVSAPRRAMHLVRRSAVAWSWALLLAALAVTAPVVALAQTAGIPIPGKPAASDSAVTPAAQETVEQQRARLVAQLDDARAQRERLLAEPPPGDAGGPTPQELTTARFSLTQLALALDAQIRAIDEMQSMQAARKVAEKNSQEWTGHAGPPPYSMLLVDGLHDAVDSIRIKVGALQAQRAIAERESERLSDEAKRAEAALRQAREAAGVMRADDPLVRQWRARAAEWSAAATGARVALFQRQITLIDEQIALENERLRLNERKLAAAASDSRLSEEDLAQVRRTEEQRMERLRATRLKVVERADRLERERAKAAEALKRVEAEPATAGPDAESARARLRAADAAVESARFELSTLDNLIGVAAATVALYSERYGALHDADAERRRAAVVRLREAAARFKPWRDYASSQLNLLRAEERESRVRSESFDDLPQVQAYEGEVASAIRQRVAVAQQLLDAAERAERTINRWLSEVDKAAEVRPFGERAADAWASARDWGRRIWNIELFAVEDTIEVAGQKITTSRGVTIGKSVGALLLFFVGYWAATRLARRFERVLIARFAMKPAQARTVRRWTLALCAFVLLVLTLNLARIPLTVFAFLGGALAIGVGFGTQTIIRNFISGLIVLMERQVQVGDTIEVDGITGTVEEVNLRSSTVRGFDGVEAIIPNSTLLENKVTNWTHTDNRIRRVVRVGVAYGSPVRKVADLLLECLQRHGHVLKDPEPQVLFEDFGDSALVFGMYLWLEMKPGVASTVVMSDLRFMVHRALEEAGVAVPFPQRDVHLDATRPLQVEITGGRPAAAG
jgi:potassium-dependent mechanosensitive channel